MTHSLQNILDHTLASRWAGHIEQEKIYANAAEILSYMNSPADFTAIGWNAVRAALIQKGNKPATINKKRSIWSVLAESAHELGAISIVPRTKGERIQEQPERYLTPEEQEKLFNLMDNDYRLTATLLVLTGMRVSELFNLEWSDVSWDSGRERICVHNTKNTRKRYLPMVSQVRAILRLRHDAGLPPSGASSSRTFEHYFLAARRKSGLEGRVTVHTLRHTFASRLVQKGVDIYKVSKLLGHTNIKTTQRYAHLAEADLEDAMSVLEN